MEKHAIDRRSSTNNSGNGDLKGIVVQMSLWSTSQVEPVWSGGQIEKAWDEHSPLMMIQGAIFYNKHRR